MRGQRLTHRQLKRDNAGQKMSVSELSFVHTSKIRENKKPHEHIIHVVFYFIKVFEEFIQSLV
jgi:hypothetical protein